MATLLCPHCYYQNKYSQKPSSSHETSQDNQCWQCHENIQDGNFYIARLTKLFDDVIWHIEKFCQPEIEAYCYRKITRLEATRDEVITMLRDKTASEVTTMMVRIVKLC